MILHDKPITYCRSQNAWAFAVSSAKLLTGQSGEHLVLINWPKGGSAMPFLRFEVNLQAGALVILSDCLLPASILP